MNRVEHLLTILTEECAEIAQRATKAQRFGLLEVEPGQTANNCARINEEVNDLFAVLEMLHREPGGFGIMTADIKLIMAKKEKVEKFLEYSRSIGTLT